MRVTPRFSSFAMLGGMSILLLIAFCVHDWWNQCTNNRNQKFVSLKTAEDELNCKYREHCSKVEADVCADIVLVLAIHETILRRSRFKTPVLKHSDVLTGPAGTTTCFNYKTQ